MIVTFFCRASTGWVICGLKSVLDCMKWLLGKRLIIISLQFALAEILAQLIEEPCFFFLFGVSLQHCSTSYHGLPSFIGHNNHDVYHFVLDKV